MENTLKRKILLLGKLPPPYMGPSVAFQILINSKLKEIFDLYFLDIKANQNLDSLGKWSFKKLWINIQKYSELMKMLSQNKPELILIPVSQSAIGFIKDAIFILICSLYPVKILIQLRGGNFKNWYDSSSMGMKSFVKFTLRKSKGVIVQGNTLRKLFESFFPSENIFVVPNGGDFKFKEKTLRERDTVKITYLGNLQSSKGIEDVIEAVSILNKSNPGTFNVEVTGEWRSNLTRERCNVMVNENKLPVKFLNGIAGDEKFNQLLSSDIFVFPPREPEGHPRVIIEAMAAGLPVLATNQGAIAESVTDGENGYIVPSHNPEMLAAKLKLLVENKQLRVQMGAASRATYLSKYTEQHMVNNYSAVFNEVMRRG